MNDRMGRVRAHGYAAIRHDLEITLEAPNHQ